MSTERAARLRNAEKLLRQEKLEEAIAEYRALVEAQPSDWNTANTLGDLYLKARATDQAVEQFMRIADGYLTDGFLPKAAALYRKVLKAAPGHEPALMKSAEIAIAQGLVGDARTALEMLRARRRERGDTRGLAEIDQKQALLNPQDFGARHRGAIAHITLGDLPAGVQALKVLAAELMGRDRRDEAIDMMREALAYAPDDGDLRLAAIEGHVRDGAIEPALTDAAETLRREPGRWPQVMRIAAGADAASRDAGRRLSQLVADQVVARQDWDAALIVLQDALSRTPRQLPLLEPLADAARATGTTDVLIEALDQIADIRLGTPEAEPPLAELVVLQPDEPRHEARLRQVRLMTGRPIAASAGPAPAEPPPPLRIVPDASAFERNTDVGSGSEPESAPEPELEAEPESGPEPDPEIRSQPEIESVYVYDAPVDEDAAVSDEIDLSIALDEIRPPAAQGGGLDPSEQEFARGTDLLDAGRTNEAIAALENASRAPRRRFEAASLLGRIFRDRGDAAQAIEWFERASEAPSGDPDATHDVFYQLAATLESAGETTRALAIYLELQADAGDYRDVGLCVERLMRVESGG